jgi:hypothetical protein
MTTQELLADGLITYSYVAAGVSHKMNLRVKLDRPNLEVGTQPSFLKYNDPNTSIDADAFTLLTLPEILKCYVSTDHFDSYVVHDMSTNPPTWIYEKSLTGYVGTHTGGNNQEARAENVFTMRDSAGRLSKVIMLGTVDGRPQKVTVRGAAFYDDFITALLSTDEGDAGAWIVSRGARHHNSFVSWCASSNNAIERKIVFG